MPAAPSCCGGHGRRGGQEAAVKGRNGNERWREVEQGAPGGVKANVRLEQCGPLLLLQGQAGGALTFPGMT